MIRKTTIYAISFFVLLTFTLICSFKIYAKNQRLTNIQHILSELDQYDPQRQFNFSSAPLVLGAYTADAQFGDGRIANLKQFFRKYNSPLYDFADHIVKVSDEYHFDYRLLPAIAMQESNLCKYIPEDSHNCWGWGIYGSTVTKFPSYSDAIDAVAKGIKQEYIDHGLITASAIMQKYTPSSNGSWAHGVNTFLQALE